MLPTFEIFGRTFASYGVLSVMGFLLSLLFIILFSPCFGADRENAVYIYVLSALGGLIGAKLLYILTVLPSFISDLPFLFTEPSEFASKYLTGGMVFYGGLTGGLLTAYFVARSYHTKLTSYLAVFVPAVLLFSAIGRIGCFCAGCCYGKETDSAFHVIFTRSLSAPNGVPLIPVQLIETAFDLTLFFVLIVLWMKKRSGLLMFELYIILYPTFRFVIEFFRGDVYRGFLFGLSTSQWISLLLIAAAGICIIFRKKKRRNYEKVIASGTAAGNQSSIGENETDASH